MLDLVWHEGQVLRGSLPSSKLLLRLELAILTIPLSDNLLLKIWLLCVEDPSVLPNVSVVDKASNGNYTLASVVSPSTAKSVHTLGSLKPSLLQIIVVPFEWRWDLLNRSVDFLLSPFIKGWIWRAAVDWEPSGLRDIGDKTFIDLRPVNGWVWIWHINFEILLVLVCVPQSLELVGNYVGYPDVTPLLPQDLGLLRAVHGLGRRPVDGSEERRDQRVPLSLRLPRPC